MSGHTDNEILIAAPFPLVWDMTNDVEAWPQLFSEYAAAQILERPTPDTVRFRLTLHPDESGRSWSWVSDRTVNVEERTTHSKRIETGPFRYMSLFWEYIETDGGVRLRWVQDFEMKPGAPLDESAMTDRLNGNTAVQLAHVRDRIEQRAAALPGHR